MALLNLSRLGMREKVGLSLAGVVLLVLVIDQLVVRQVARRLRELDESIDQTEKRCVLNQEDLKDETTVSRSYAEISGLVGTASSPEEAINAFKGEVDDLARQNGVSLISMEHRNPRSEEFYDAYAVEVRKYEATTEALARFLHQLWSAPGMLRVASLDISPGAEPGKIGGSMVIGKPLLRPE